MSASYIAIFSIVVLNLVLSGDNVVVIGMAVHRLPEKQRRLAILAGGGLALLLRIVLTAVAAILLQIPLLQLLGGLVLAWVVYNLLICDEADIASDGGGLGAAAAIRTIIIADITMSTDNVLAVGAAARGDVPLLIFGLVVSMAIVMLGGSLVSTLMNKIAWLKYVGAAVLVRLAGEMIAGDKWLLQSGLLPSGEWVGWTLTALLTAAVAIALYLRRRRASSAISPVLQYERSSSSDR